VSGPHAECRKQLLDHFEAAGIRVTVSAAAPGNPTAYTQALKCPHGTVYWFEPTVGQIATWAEKGVE
jgi:hypothetical protein